VVERLNAKPVPLRVPDGRSGPPRKFAMTGDRFAFVIWQSLYYSEAIPHLRRIIFDTAAGNIEWLARLIEKTTPSAGSSVGMQHSVECTEMMPFMKPDQFRPGESGGVAARRTAEMLIQAQEVPCFQHSFRF
jgi:hypothetical protein